MRRNSALALQIPLNDEPIIETIADPDAFDAADSLVYQNLECDCGNEIGSNNRCAWCGAHAPWSAKLGCGLA